MRALNLKLVRDLRLQLGQLVSIALLVACGVTTFVGMRSTREALRRARAEYYSRYRFGDVFATLKRAPQSLAQRINEIPGVGMVDTRVVLPATFDVPGLQQLAAGLLVSVPSTRRAMLNDLHLYRGRYVSPSRDDEALVSLKFAGANGLEPGDSIEAVVNGRWKRLRIVGIASSPEYIYEIGQGGFVVDNRTYGIVWMRREALAASGNLVGAFNDVSLLLTNRGAERSVLASLDHLLAPFGGVGSVGRSRQTSAEVIDNEMVQLDALAWFFPLLFLGIAMLLLNVVLTRLITSQRGEIGTLKAFGYPDLTVGAHFLGLALSSVVLGSVVGLLGADWLGRTFTAMYKDYFDFPTLAHRTDAASAIAGVAASALAALVGAGLAVRAAVRMSPVAAMRPPAPTRFRRLLLERIGAFSSRPKILMVARDIARRPVRSASSVIGIGFAGAVLVAGMYPFDSVDSLIDLQFRVAQRDNVTVTFAAPRGSRALLELRALPGVERAEGFRATAVRFHSRQVSRLSAITGLDTATTLRQLLDTRGGRYRMPADALVLSTSLGRALGVAPGDLVQVEFLERGGARHPVRVAGLVDEAISGGGYMERRALNRLIGEGDVQNGAYLAVSAANEAAVYARLKRLPLVAATSSRMSLLAFFERSIADSIFVSATIVIFAAAVIAVGIIYNNSRITISERARELASLRVLGFTRGEVSRLFLGEEGILTIAGLPLAAVTGFGLATLLSHAFATERYNFPVALQARSYIGSAVLVLLIAVGVALVVRRRLDRLDMLGTLKVGE